MSELKNYNTSTTINKSKIVVAIARNYNVIEVIGLGKDKAYNALKSSFLPDGLSKSATIQKVTEEIT